MRKKCCIVWAGLLLLCLTSASAEAATIYVNQTGWWLEGNIFNESSIPIQEAVDNASVLGANVIRIDNGLYNGPINVTQTQPPQWLYITSNGTGVPTVNGTFSGYVFNMSVNNVTIQGLRLTNATYGVYVHGPVVNLTVTQCNIDVGLTSGVYIDGCIGCTLDNNTIQNFQQYGVYLNNSTSCQIANNTVSSQNGWGIYLNSSSSNTIWNNYFASQYNAYDNGQNQWNLTTPVLGTNIIGGNMLGGNFWSDLNGDDYDGNGIADYPLPYNYSGNITNGGDYMPLLALYFVQPTPANWNATKTNVTINVTYVISDMSDVWLNFNGTFYNITSNLNQTINVDALSTGYYWYYVNMTGTNGMRYQTATRTLIIDKTNPSIDQFLQPFSWGETVEGNVTIMVRAYDPPAASGIANVSFYYDNYTASNVFIGQTTTPQGQNNDIWTVVWNTAGIFDGEYTIRAVAYDNVSNWNTIQINVTLDNDKVVTHASSDLIQTFANQSVTFYVNYTHYGIPVDNTTDGGTCTITVTFQTFTAQGPGNPIIYSAPMTYNSTSGLYEHTNSTGFPAWGQIRYTVQCNNTAGYENVTVTNTTWVTYYRSMSGHIYNLETGQPVANAVISVEQEDASKEPPTVGWTCNTVSNDTGYYKIVFNGTESPLTSVYYIRARSQDSTLTTPILPPMPGPFPEEANKTDVNLFLVQAANLTLRAYNNSGYTTFNAEIFDRDANMPIKSIQNAGPGNYSLLVPAGRNYDIVVYKEGMYGAPPTSQSWLNASGSHYLEVNLTVTMVTVSGSLSGVSNAEYYNVTGFIGISTFYPRNFNAVFNSQVNTTTNTYTIQIPGTSSGISYVIIAYAKNSSGYYSGSTKLTAYSSGISNQNITLYPLYGTYRTGNIVSTNMTRFVFRDDSNNNITGVFAMINITEVNGNSTAYVTSSQGNNYIDIPITQGSTVTASFFSPMAPPRKRVINPAVLASNDTINIILPNMEFKDPNTNNPLENVSLKFIKCNGACNVPYPSSTCVIYEVSNATDFDPMKAMMAGNINIRTEQQNGLVVEFVNVDLVNSGPPDASFSPNATEQVSAQDTFAQMWIVGSFAPDIYDYVLIGIPYNESELSENAPVKVKFRYLYDDNFDVIWNASVNSTSDVVALGYGDFNQNYFGDGVTCSDTYSTLSPSGACYRNKTDNMIWFTIPHFSGGAPQVIGYIPGKEPSTSVSTASSAPSGGGAGGGGYVVTTTPEETVTSAPSPAPGTTHIPTYTPTHTPAYTPAPSITKTPPVSTPAPSTPWERPVPGFEALFAIAGLITAAYLLRRR